MWFLGNNLLFLGDSHFTQNLLRRALDAAEAPCETEVAELDRAVLVDEDVGGLEVTMDDLALVEELYRAQQIINYGLNVEYLQLKSALEDLL